MTPAHADLVFAAKRWLLGAHRCDVALTECGRWGERPDAIGWRQRFSTLIECKASHADFVTDRRKRFRRVPSLGMGYYRWYLTPPGLVCKEELPPRWGLAELRHGRVFKVVRAEPFHERSEADEMILLVSAVWRLENGRGLRQFVPEPKHPIEIRRGSVALKVG